LIVATATLPVALPAILTVPVASDVTPLAVFRAIVPQPTANTAQTNRVATDSRRAPWPSGDRNITRRKVTKTTDLSIRLRQKTNNC
jgi:hypothetical protein